MKRPLIVGNWKMHGDGSWLPALGAIAQAACASPSIDTAICVPATLIHRAATLYPALSIGGQNCHAEPAGAYTGAIAASMIREAGGQHVIVGHSDCRAEREETNARIAAKVGIAQAAGLHVILCVGEGVGVSPAVETVCDQLWQSLPQALRPEIAVAYEPIWAIGSGFTPKPEDVRTVTTGLRSILRQRLGADPVILYGGSVTPYTAPALLSVGSIDGFLIGKASLCPDAFTHLMALLAQAQ